MPKTLDDIQSLLTRCGYTCQRMVDVIVATTVATKVYKNPAGENTLEIMVTFDHANHCVAVEVLRAFELRDAAHKEAALTCLMTAAGRTPLLRPTLEPEGTVGLRIDCTCGRNGAREGDVLQAVALLASWVEVWFPQVCTAMEHGKFNAHDVPHLNLLRMNRGGSFGPSRSTGRHGTGAGGTGQPGRQGGAGAGSESAGGSAVAPKAESADTSQRRPSGSSSEPCSEQASEHTTDASDAAGTDSTADDDDRSPGMGTIMRAAAISEKPGAHPNRLRVLFDFLRTLDQENRGQADQN